jgi:hypothetical protein
MRDRAAVRAKCEEIRDDIAAGFLELDINDSDLGALLGAAAEGLRAVESIEWGLCTDSAVCLADLEDSDIPA